MIQQFSNITIQQYNNLVDIRQTPQYANFMEKIGWRVVALPSRTLKIKPGFPKNNFIYIKQLPLLPFSLIKILRSHNLVQLNELKNLVKKYNPLIIKQQPFILIKQNTYQFNNLIIQQFKPDLHPLLPTKTVWLDLAKTRSKLLKEMTSKTRYNIKKTQSAGWQTKVKTKIISGDNINNDELSQFYCLWKKNKPFNWLFKPSLKELRSLVDSFDNKCFFVFILTSHFSSSTHFSPPNLLAATLILCSSNMAFYWHNCSSLEGKKLFAPTLAVWQALLESQKRCLRVFDFEGIWDKRLPQLNKGWQGFSRFKKGFGGKEIELVKPLTLLPGGA